MTAIFCNMIQLIKPENKCLVFPAGIFRIVFKTTGLENYPEILKVMPIIRP